MSRHQQWEKGDKNIGNAAFSKSFTGPCKAGYLLVVLYARYECLMQRPFLPFLAANNVWRIKI